MEVAGNLDGEATYKEDRHYRYDGRGYRANRRMNGVSSVCRVE
jgi:hypothetical protein